MLYKYAAPVAALLASAAAQSSCTFDATTITNAADATAIAGCSAVKGNAVFATGAANPTLSLTSVETWDGDLTYEKDDTLSLFSAPKLSEITGALKLDTLKSLGNIDLSALKKSGDVTIMSCASLSMVTTGTQYQEAGKVSISNTQLSTLGGFGNLSKIMSLDVSGNTLLAEISMNINTVGSILIGSNQEANKGLSVKFDNLTRANSVSVNNASVVSFNQLQSATGNLNFYYNKFEEFSLPNLTSAGGLIMNSNDKLTNLTFPQLMSINGSNTGGAFAITNNTQLKSLGGFDGLSRVNGSVVLAGVFENITSIDNFKMVTGTFRVSSTADIGDSICPKIKNLKSSNVVRGAWSCTGQSKSTVSGVGGSATGEGSSSSSSAAAGVLQIPAIPTLGAGFGAFLLQFLLSF